MAYNRNDREQSWDSIQSSDASQELQASIEDDMNTMQPQPRIRTIQDVHDVIHPLRKAADRVGQEVEAFANSLDRLANERSGFEDCRKVLPMVREYEKIATATVARLRKVHEPERQERLKGKWKRKVEQTRTPTPSVRTRSNGMDDVTTVEDLENWEQERQTWQLLRLLLQCHYPAPRHVQALPNQEAKYQQPPAGMDLNEYCSEHEVWNQFLGDYNDIWEKHIIVEWLKSNAESNGPSIDVVVEELDEAADRGRGLSAHGWLYSKEAIKAQKRLRSWPQPLETTSSGPGTGLMNKEKTARLVTQLDPDAFSRQSRDIETQDIFFERAAWLGCWEMMRRGESWEAIRNFCQDRVEGWRALVIRGDPRQPNSSRSNLNLQTGPQSRVLWRKMCDKAAQDGGIDDYENAVYGLLSGNYEAVEKVARGWDDHLFALYNSQILRQFDYFLLKTYPRKLPDALDSRATKRLPDAPKPTGLSGQDAWESLLSYTKTKSEARSPLKMIQGSLIAKAFERYIHQQGLALGRSVARSGLQGSAALRGTSDGPIELGASADVSVDDYDTLRIMTHIILVFMEMGVIKEGSVAIENIIFAYVSFLANAGKYELLPVYAKKLSGSTRTELMARQLHMVTNDADQKIIMKLMHQYGFDTKEILRRQLELLLDQTIPRAETKGFAKLDMLSSPKQGPFDMAIIKSRFLTADISPVEADLIHAVEWYLYLDDAWEDTFRAGTTVYKHFLRTGAFSAAAMLAGKMPLSYISEHKTPFILGVSVDLSLDRNSGGDTEEERKVEIMLRQADTYRCLENLVNCFMSLEFWKDVFDHFRLNDAAKKNELQKAHAELVQNVETIMTELFHYPESDEEKLELEEIRNAYVPDIILGYISALYFDGHKLSREILLKIMNLAIDIAAHNSEVGAAFKAAGRMSELMDYMATGSFAVLRAEETMVKKKGGRKKPRKIPTGARGENLDIWNMTLPTA